MSGYKNSKEIPHRILSSDANVKNEDETQHNFGQNDKKLIITSARVLGKNEKDGDSIKLPQKTQENDEGQLPPDNNGDDKILQAEQNEYYIFLNRFLYSKNVIKVYVLLFLVDLGGIVNVIVSLVKAETTIVPAFVVFWLLSLCIFADMYARYYISELKNYLRSCSTYLDLIALFLVVLGTIFYFVLSDKIRKIPLIVIGLYIGVRFFVFIVSLCRKRSSESAVRNIEEVINFSAIFEDGKKGSDNNGHDEVKMVTTGYNINDFKRNRGKSNEVKKISESELISPRGAETTTNEIKKGNEKLELVTEEN